MPGEGLKILLVDDEKHFADTLAARLEMRGFEVRTAYNGLEALAAIAVPADVAVLDLRMPGMDGLEVLHEFKQRTPEMQVIILSGHVDDKEEQAAYAAGALSVLRKPLHIDELLDIIHTIRKTEES